MQNVAAISELLKPYDAQLMRCYPVSRRINDVANDDAECSRPVEIVEAQNRLLGREIRLRRQPMFVHLASAPERPPDRSKFFFAISLPDVESNG